MASTQVLAIDSAPGYMESTSGNILRSGSGDCVHTGSWESEGANIVGCDDYVLNLEAEVIEGAPSGLVPVSSSISLTITFAMAGWAGWGSLIDISLALANFGCVECSNSDSLPANRRGNYMSTFRKTTPGVQMGRPPKPAGAGRNRRVVTFVTEDEYAELKALASDGSISLSALCNDMVTTALHKKRSRRIK